MRPLSILSIISMILATPASQARLDSQAGTRVTIAMAQSILAAPPLPGLDSKESGLAVQGSHMVTHMSGFDDYGMLHYNADFTGGAVSVGYTSKMSGDFNWFAIGQYNQSTGEGNTELNTPIGVNRIKADGYVGVMGAGYRVIGKDDGAFALGLFAGGGAMKVSSQTILGGDTFYSDSEIYGPLVGAQTRIKFGKISIRPYGLFLYEATDQCKRTVTNSGYIVSTGKYCRENAWDTQNIPATFSAYGLVLGYGHLVANVYSKLVNDESMKDLEMFNYSIGWTF